MKGRKRKLRTEKRKKENGADLKTGEEIERAFRRRLQRTFQRNEEDSEGVVKEWVGLSEG